jgi:serine/threonine protein kinase
MVVKDSFIGYGWNSRTLWRGPIDRRVSHEAYLHRKLSTGHPSVVEFLGDHVDRTLRTLRLYTAYGEMGDLYTLLLNHNRLHNRVDDKGNLLGKAARLPAVVVVYLCEAMAASVCLMAHGQLPDDQGVWPGLHGRGDGDGDGDDDAPDHPWPHDIIHRDIKPANYFLTQNKDPTRWRNLPIACLGDFGNGVDLQDPWWEANPDERKHGGTINWEAPEQQPGIPIPVTSAVNVFQVGLVMYHLLTLVHPEFQMSYEDPEDRRPFPRTSKRAYPRDLTILARECTNCFPDQRPSPKELYLSMRMIAQDTNGSTTVTWGKLTRKLKLQPEHY